MYSQAANCCVTESHQQCEKLSEENKKLKSVCESQEAKTRDVMKMMATQAEKVHILKRKSEGFVSTDAMETQKAEIITVKDGLINQEGAIARLERATTGSTSGTFHNSIGKIYPVQKIKLITDQK